MRKKNNSTSEERNVRKSNIPDITIIDLEVEDINYDSSQDGINYAPIDDEVSESADETANSIPTGAQASEDTVNKNEADSGTSQEEAPDENTDLNIQHMSDEDIVIVHSAKPKRGFLGFRKKDHSTIVIERGTADEKTSETIQVPAHMVSDVIEKHTSDEAARKETATEDITENLTPVEEALPEIEEEIFGADEEDDEITGSTILNSFLSIHSLLILVFLILVVCIVVKFKNWGERIDSSTIQWDGNAEYLDVLDYIAPLVDENGFKAESGQVKNIVVFGNAPFADDRDSNDNLAKLLAKESGAKVYNCSISGSYLASQWPYFSADEYPMDAYCFYWLSILATTGINDFYYDDAAARLGDDKPAEADEVIDTIQNLDFNKVDVAIIMYDATDYLLGHKMYSDTNPTDIEQFTGNLEAGIEVLQREFPNMRIIVMSPTYAYATDTQGNYVSSDMYRYGQDVLSTYVIKEYGSCASRNVTFIDNLYGTITEDNAQDYLIDNLHINVDGRRKLVDRMMYAINYYNSDEE